MNIEFSYIIIFQMRIFDIIYHWAMFISPFIFIHIKLTEHHFAVFVFSFVIIYYYYYLTHFINIAFNINLCFFISLWNEETRKCLVLCIIQFLLLSLIISVEYASPEICIKLHTVERFVTARKTLTHGRLEYGSSMRSWFFVNAKNFPWNRIQCEKHILGISKY